MTKAPLLAGLFKLWGYVATLLLAVLVFGLLAYAPIKAWLGAGESFSALSLWPVLLEGTITFMPVALATWTGLRLLDQRPVASIGLACYPKMLFELGAGVIVGAGMLLALIAIDGVWAWFGGGVFEWPRVAVAGGDLLGLAVFMAFVALNEELLVRGYPMQVLIRYTGVLPAVVLTSVLFGMLHITGDAWNAAVVVVDTGLSGVIFALAYLKTRALWMPIALHFANNFIIFAFTNPDLDQVNVIPPELSQQAFWGWWLVNFPLYLVVIWGLWRWPYQPDAKMEALYRRFVAPLQTPERIDGDGATEEDPTQPVL